MKYRYKIYCDSDNKWEHFDTLMPRLVCPVDSNHTVRAKTLIKHGESLVDYQVLRANLATQIASEGFETLNANDKYIASKHFVTSKTDRDSVMTMERQIAERIIYHKHSIGYRLQRRLAVEGEIFNRLQVTADKEDFIGDVRTLFDNYVDFGNEGTVEGGAEALFDYLESRSGTSYENTGLLSKSGYTIEGMTLAQLSAKVMDIFKNGNY